jgi:hypothetical protein
MLCAIRPQPHDTDIPGVEPAISIEGVSGGLCVAHVAQEEIRRFDQNLPRFIVSRYLFSFLSN